MLKGLNLVPFMGVRVLSLANTRRDLKTPHGKEPGP